MKSTIEQSAKYAFLSAVCILCFSSLRSQDTGVNGLVRDASGSPVQGASIIAGNSRTGFSAGTITDSTGKFYFRGLPAGGPYRFEVSALNFDPQVLSGYTLKNEELLSLLITMRMQILNLQEVVVTGYSDKKRGELTSAISTISSEKLKDVTTNDVGAMLQGKVPGLQIVSSSGAPGGMSEIRLRGVSSINAGLNPLYVVDGIIGGNFDVNDIETISVLKDAGATALYGSQANGGVIVVTTKTAKSNKIRFEAKVASGIRKPDFGTMQLMNTSQLYEYQKEFYRDYIPGESNNSFKIDLLKFYNERPLSLLNQNTNWLETMFSTAPMQNIYFSASGKTGKADYYLGMTYYHEKGTFTNTSFNRINVRANSTYRFSKNVNLINNINLSGSRAKSYNYNDLYYAYLNLPWDHPYDSLGNALYVDGLSEFKWWSRDKVNPVHTLEHSDYPSKNLDANYDLVFNWNITGWLRFSSSNRMAAAINRNTYFIDGEAAGTYHDAGFLNEQAQFNYGLITTNLLKFNVAVKEKHQLNGLAGLAWEGAWNESLGGSGKGLPPGLKVLDVVSNNILINGNNDEHYIGSYISQLNYNYDNRYFVSASYRYDGSSAFPPSKRYGSFPSLSAAWNLANEQLLKGFEKLNVLKIRASWGITGTQDIGASRYLGLFGLNNHYNNQSAAVPYQLPSPLLTWESKYQTNLGLDLGLWNRVTLNVDVYKNNTKNLLLQVPVPLSVGMETKWENVGGIINKGVEFGLSSVNISSTNFDWATDFNISFNSNKLKDLPTPITKTGPWAISQIYKNDGDIYEFYMPRWMGVDPQTGSPLWEVVHSDSTGKITGRETTSDYSGATYQEAGSALPSYQGSITSRWRYKGLTLSVNTYFSGGNYVYSNNLRFVMNDGHEPYYNQIAFPLDYSIWAKPGDIATNPSPQNAANSNLTSTRFLYKGDFLSIRNVSLAYALPQAFTNKLGMDGVTLAFSADNVHTFTKFLGQDVQTTITPGQYVTPGVSDFKYPNNRQYLFSLSFRF